MNKNQLQGKVAQALNAIELLEKACSNPDMSSWDRTAIHVEELSRIKRELVDKYSPLIEALPPEKPNPDTQLSQEEKAALNSYKRCEAQIEIFEAFIARKTHYHENIGKTGFLIPELEREISSDLPYSPKYRQEDKSFAVAITKFEQHKNSYPNLRNMLGKTQDPQLIRALLEEFIKTYRTLRLAVETERGRIQAEAAKKETLWKKLNDISTPLVKQHGIDLQNTEPYKTLGEQAAQLYAQVGNEERNRTLQDIIEKLEKQVKQLDQERETKLDQLNKQLEQQLASFNHLYENIAKQLEKAGIDDSIISEAKERFDAAYQRQDSEADEVQFKTEKLATLKKLIEEFNATIISEQQYISSGLISAIDKIADKFAQHLHALEKQLEGRDIKFADEDQMLIEKTKKDFAIDRTYQGLMTPNILEGKLDDITKKEKEFDGAWSKVVAAVKRGFQARVEELKNSVIPQQNETFKYFYQDNQNKLVAYGLWEENKNLFTPIEQAFAEQYEDVFPNDGYTHEVDFYQAKQKALSSLIEELQNEIINMQGAICTAIIEKVDAIAVGVEQAQRDIRKQFQDQGFEFTEEENQLIEQMNALTVQRAPETYSEQTTGLLEPILQAAEKKEKELNEELLPGIRTAIKRCRQIKIEKLKETIDQQQQTFKNIFDKAYASLGKYELDQEAVSAINREFDETYAALNKANVDDIVFYQSKQKTLSSLIEKLNAEVINSQRAICTAIIKKVNAIAVSVEQEKLDIRQQFQDQGFEFTEEENQLIEQMNALTVQRVPESGKGEETPERLELILQAAEMEEKKLKEELLPGIKVAIKRCRQIKIETLQETIAQQQQAFKNVFEKVHANLGKYALDQGTVSAINQEFDEKYAALNEGNVDGIVFHQGKLIALQTIAQKLRLAVVQAEKNIAAELIKRINTVADDIHQNRQNSVSKIKETYQLLEDETRFVTELKTPLVRDYQQWVEQAKLEEHLQTLQATKDGLAVESEKIDKIVERHELASNKEDYTAFFKRMNGADEAEAEALLVTVGKYLTDPQKLREVVNANLHFINAAPALKVIENLVKNDVDDTLGINDKIAFIKRLSAKNIVVQEAFLNKGSNQMAVVKLLNEKGLDRFITGELLGNEDLCKALLLIEKYKAAEISEDLMSNNSIELNKMAIIITKLDDFVNNYQGEESAKQELRNFRKEALPVLLTTQDIETKRKESINLARTHFQHRHFYPRLLADVLQFITGAFLVIMPIKYLAFGQHPLFSLEATNRETQVQTILSTDMDDDAKKDEPPVEPETQLKQQ
ncbi:Uncharacterised protein [Legionella lansingensis]|uniref:Uncharacterized protein n=1 Tax=Legionella lansingensis TaxID=45067 RepID=A0A0W0VLJ7_9GAMM|nr:hypothetical protein [Legionella lansingensis]KTD20894.1 hypothetical protein Llan_1624 [Legionella lansingensis]SNV43840.1 Uncharacterised protein [Legionella lansingensis]